MVDFLFIIFFILFWAIFFPCSDDGIASKKFKKKIEKNIDIRYWLIVDDDDEIFFFISSSSTTSTSSYQITIIFFWLSDYNRITTTTTTNFSITKLTHTHTQREEYKNRMKEFTTKNQNHVDVGTINTH